MLYWVIGTGKQSFNVRIYVNLTKSKGVFNICYRYQGLQIFLVSLF